MGDFAVSSRLGVRTIFNGTATTAADPAIALAAALHQERWNNTFRSLALLHIPLSSTQSGDAERVWADEWVASAILVPGFVTWLERTT